jgi:hypothetical protein
LPVNASVVAWTDGHQEYLAEDFGVLARVHLEPGRSYVVLAKGNIRAWEAEATFRLEALDATDETEFTQGRYPEALQGGDGEFLLTIAIVLPDDEELYVDATLSGRMRQGLSGPLPLQGQCMVDKVKLIALAVDSLSITA